MKTLNPPVAKGVEKVDIIGSNCRRKLCLRTTSDTRRQNCRSNMKTLDLLVPEGSSKSRPKIMGAVLLARGNVIDNNLTLS